MSHLESLFEGTELSEEFKEKATAIFATAIDEKVAETKTQIETQLKEEYEAKVETKLQELEEASKAYISEEVMPSVDKYLTAAVQEWVNENAVAIESNAKVSLAESFLTGLVGLAAEHRLSLPEGQDQVEVLQKKVDELSEKAKELIDTNIDLQTEITSFKKAQVVESVTKQLSEAQKDKFGGVVQNVEYKNDEQYTNALKSLVESYFPVEGENGNKEFIQEQQEIPSQKETLSPEDAYVRRLTESVLGKPKQ